ncbi:uncharacterized protein METZ01_LOCUS195431, partial [marine metagenome]
MALTDGHAALAKAGRLIVECQVYQVYDHLAFPRGPKFRFDHQRNR